MTFYRRRHKEMLYATSFAAFLVALTIGMISLSFVAVGPIILGTEMNTNGLVEYLCLGSGCDNLRDINF